jgi:putative peptidoglycan lipid II flippase
VFAPLAHKFGFEPVLGLAVGTLLGGFLQFSYQAVPLYSLGFFRSIRFSLHDGSSPIKEMMFLMFPRMIGQGAFSIALFINTHYATAAGVGAISYITNAQNIILVPVGLFGVAGGFASLPLLTESCHKKDSESFWRLLGASCLSNAWMSALSVVGLAILAVPLCQVLLQHGKVTQADTLMNALAVVAYSGSILFNSMNKILTQGFYALGDTKQILVNSVCYLIVNAVLSSWLAPKYGVLGLGISNCTAAAADLFLNLWFLPHRAKSFGLADLKPFLHHWRPRVLMGLLATGMFSVALSLWAVQPFFADHGQSILGSFWKGFTLLGIGGSVTVILWLLCLNLFGPEPLKRTLLGRFRQNRNGLQ